jgi:hypothetical protein
VLRPVAPLARIPRPALAPTAGRLPRQLGVEFVVPAHLGLDVQHAAPHDRGRERADVALGQQAFPLGGELGGGDRQAVPPVPQRLAQFLAVHVVDRERERYPQRVRSRLGRPDRALPQGHQLQPAIGRDLVHGPRRAPPHLFRADPLHQALALHRAQLPVERPDADPAPLADVGQVGEPPDLVPVLRSVPGKGAKRHQPRQIHEISIMRLISCVKSVPCPPRSRRQACVWQIEHKTHFGRSGQSPAASRGRAGNP